MSRYSGIVVRFGSADHSPGELPPIEIEHVARARETLAGDRYAYDRLWAACRPASLVLLSTAGVLFAAYGIHTAPYSLRIPLARSGESLASLGDLSARFPEIFDLQDQENEPALPLAAPPLQELQASLPASPGPAPLLPAVQQSGLLTFDATQGNGAPVVEQPTGDASKLGKLARSAGSVRRGTFIPAILETPVEPGTPSGVRAFVPADVAVRGPGAITIPRSSRLVGQYYSKETGGRKRVYIIWKQLILPNGKVSEIASGSIAKDQFFDSFGGASMISILEGEQGQSGAMNRVRTGEPLRIVTARDVELAGIIGTAD